MEFGILLSIVGIPAGITGTWFFAWYYYRRYPGRITFVKESCIGLFESIVQNLSDLQISYQKNPLIQNNLVLLEGSFINTGTKDITSAMVEKPQDALMIILPEGFR